MSTNTIVKAQKEVFNDAVRGLVDSSVFLGVTSYVSEPWVFQGSNYAYLSGGTYGPTSIDTIQKYALPSGTTVSDVGDLTEVKAYLAGQSSSTNGYTSGGLSPPLVPTVTNAIEKFPFASDGNASNIGTLTLRRFGLTGQSSSTHGYSSGGREPPTSYQRAIDKFPFSADENASSVGNLITRKYEGAGQSSTTHGYASGGTTPTLSNSIEKFSFASDASASDVGDLTITRSRIAGQSSSTHGYVTGGSGGPSEGNRIDKFSFASDGNASDIANLVRVREFGVGHSGTEYGYHAGGGNPSGVDKFSFVSDANATSLFNFGSTYTNNGSGQQY